MNTEKALQDYLIKRCKQNNMLCDKMESKSRRGFPDLIIMFRGRVVFVEMKSPKLTGVLSALQKRCIKDIADHGGWVFVVQTRQEADTLIDLMTSGGVHGIVS